MGFQVVSGTPHIGWFPVDATDTIYVGQIVTTYNKAGCLPVGAGVYSGNNTYNKPWGVVVGTAEKNPLYDTTYKTEKTIGITPHAQTRELVGAETMNPRGDQQMYVQVAIITPETIIQGSICNATFGTAPIVGTVSANNTTGDGFTTSACGDVAPLAAMGSTVYCRTGANRGIYRVGNTTSTTTVAVLAPYFPFDFTIGDTVMSMPFRPFGHTLVQFDSEAMFIDSAGNCNNTGWAVNMLRVDLTTAGAETALFMFNSISLTCGIAGIDYA